MDMLKKLVMSLSMELKTQKQAAMLKPKDGGVDKQQMMEMVGRYRKVVKKNRLLAGKKDRLEQMVRSFQQREQYNNKLLNNYKVQLHQMEQAVLIANQLHNREKVNWQKQLLERDNEIRKLKIYLQQFISKSQQTKTKMRNVAKPIRAGNRKKTNRFGSKKGASALAKRNT